MNHQQMIYYGRKVSNGKHATLIQGLYIQDGRIICETKRVEPGKPDESMHHVMTKETALRLARAHYIEKMMEFAEKGLLDKSGYQHHLNVLHSRAKLIEGVKAE